jgi:PAS domain S-box-containing protein
VTQQKTHSLLQRQIKRHYGEESALPAKCREFVADINEAYFSFDDDRAMLERALDLSSQELMEANAESRALFQTLPDLFFRVDRDGVILSLKAGARDDLALHPHAVVGKRIQDAPLASVARQFEEALIQTRNGNGVMSVQYELNNNGKPHSYEARFVPIPERQTVIIIRNITAQKQLEEQLRQAQKMEAFGQLAGGVAHDFNNILMVIRGNLELLAGFHCDPMEVSAHDEIVAAIDKAANMTRQLLTFSRRQPILPRVIDLNVVVAGMARMLQRLIGEHVSLETRLTSERAQINGDAGMLEQVIMNLVINARDAMPRGGRVVISTVIIDTDESGEAVNPNAKPGVHVCMRVTDTGSGISPEDLPHIFEPFFTTKETGKGTGLGLATVFGIIEQHNGWIDVESLPGAGTTMQVFLPTLTQGMVPRAEPEPLTEAPGGFETIFLVEDEKPVRELLRRILENHGYRVFESNSGPEAIELWRSCKEHVDLLFTDMIMPGGITGWELAKLFVKDRPQLKVVLCSGYVRDFPENDPALGKRCRFVEKPVASRAILETVRALLDGS